jgi:hypothetical protein
MEELLPYNGCEEKWSNDTPTGEGRSSDGNKIEEIKEAHPRNASSNKNRQEETESDVVQALEANNLSYNKARVPYPRTIEHDGVSVTNPLNQILSPSERIKAYALHLHSFPNTNQI